MKTRTPKDVEHHFMRTPLPGESDLASKGERVRVDLSDDDPIPATEITDSYGKKTLVLDSESDLKRVQEAVKRLSESP